MDDAMPSLDLLTEVMVADNRDRWYRRTGLVVKKRVRNAREEFYVAFRGEGRWYEPNQLIPLKT